MSGAILASLCAALALGGCLSAAEERPDAAGGEGAAGAPGPGGSIPSANATVPQLRLEGCVHWQAFVALPRAFLPGEAPSGWGSGDPAGPGRVGAKGFLCEKVSLGPFERGPFALVTDDHSNAEIPAACQDEQPLVGTSYGVLHTVLVGDPEVGDYLARTYGMPVLSAGIDATQGAGPLPVQDWRWTPEGGQASALSIPDDGVEADGPAFQRLFWETDGRIAELELQVVSSGSFGARGATGRFAPPMLLSEVGGGPVAVQAEWHSSAEATGGFRLYQDLFCEVPEA